MLVAELRVAASSASNTEAVDTTLVSRTQPALQVAAKLVRMCRGVEPQHMPMFRKDTPNWPWDLIEKPDNLGICISVRAWCMYDAAGRDLGW